MKAEGPQGVELPTHWTSAKLVLVEIASFFPQYPHLAQNTCAAFRTTSLFHVLRALCPWKPSSLDFNASSFPCVHLNCSKGQPVFNIVLGIEWGFLLIPSQIKSHKAKQRDVRSLAASLCLTAFGEATCLNHCTTKGRDPQMTQCRSQKIHSCISCMLLRGTSA